MESRTIEFIEPHSEVTFESSVTITGSVGQGAKIKMKNGSLIIKGSVEPDVQIEMINNIWQKPTHPVEHECISKDE